MKEEPACFYIFKLLWCYKRVLFSYSFDIIKYDTENKRTHSLDSVFVAALSCRCLLLVRRLFLFSRFGAWGTALLNRLYCGSSWYLKYTFHLLTSSSTTFFFTHCCLSRMSLPSTFSPAVHHALSCPAFNLTNWRTDEEDGEDESGASRGGVHDNLYRVHMPSLYSCGSSYGSEASLPATAHTVSNAPVTEYMWVSTHR